MGSAAFREAWSFARGLTLDLIDTMDGEDLLFTPGPSLGPFWKQFRHVGRVQENYLGALETGRIRFDWTDTYRDGPSRDALAAYLRSVDERLWRVLASVDEDLDVDWDGERISIDVHLQRLIAHETLHHGQWVVYIRLTGGSFPPSWSAWGL